MLAPRSLAAGEGELVVTDVGGTSVIERSIAKSPLKLLTPRNHGRAAWTFVANFGGGLVDGDHLALDVRVRAGAAALIGTQAQTKVYRSQTDSMQTLEAEVEEGALLVLVPDPVACFAGSRYSQKIAIRLAANASLVFLDGFTAGRVARGERWQMSRYASRVEVFCEGKPAFVDSLLLDPAHGELAARMGRMNAFSTLVALGPLAAEGAASILRGLAPLSEKGELVESASAIVGGAVFRVAATSIERVLASTKRRLAWLAGAIGDDAFARKW